MTVLTRRYVHIDEADRSLSVQEDRPPVPGAEEVLIEVAAAGVNRADLLQWKGLYPPPPDASPIIGLEVSGRVVACGEAVTDFELGDRVCALTHGGGYASHAIAPQGQTLTVPKAFDLNEAAALPEALLTVWHNLFQRAGLRAGENVLIHGGASGIGTLGVGICKAMGANVYSTAGSKEKCRRVEALGAIKAFNYKEEDFAEGLDALGLKGQISVILDMVGGDYIGRNFEVAAPEGRIVNIAFLRGFSAEVNFLPMLIKRLTMTGSTLRAQSEVQKAQMVREIREQLLTHLDDGSIKAVIDKEFPLEEAQAALEYMESGVHMGKILLRP
ncbi:NAD(P)H-quinone oxidoreductase [Congregibacter brevis]|uniref:NAD(P)H-quinone oxidoreductase n=1 Tax=Congregibacter brevis TaxID=3081201 RepID=A0ABZ0IDK1_9GAMM|nr:NAD(P)H-quinone oxidoreductase [Congregibacter sp. IMCC45268]